MGLRDKIKRVVRRHPEHPLDFLWKWAVKPDSLSARQNRFRALNAYALDRWAIAKKNHWNPAKWWNAHLAYAKKLQWFRNHADPKPPPDDADHLMWFDGRQVPEWIGHILQEARNDGVYFRVISGYRSPAYSEQLCYQMCGAPTCPGRCAGRYSNHACPPSGTGVPYEGAVDVSPGYSALESWCRRHNKPLYGGGYALPSDLPHFSHSGR